MKNCRSSLALLASVSALASVAHGSAAFAQDTSGASNSVGLEEIVVTARRNEESLMQVPLSITAMTANQLAVKGVTGLDGISDFSPGFHFTQQSSGASGRNDRSTRQLTFRGLSVAGGVLFVDGTPVNGSMAPPMEDVERVEVLKGPQSVYFGRSTYIGAVSYTTKDPSETFGARIGAEYGNYGSNKLSGAIEGPLLFEGLTGRISASHDFKGGQYKNFGDTSVTMGDQKTRSLSATLAYNDPGRFKAKAHVTLFTNEDGPPAQAAFKSGEMNCDLGGTRGAYFCGTLPKVSEIDPYLISGNWSMTPEIREQLIENPLGFMNVFDPRFLQAGGLKANGAQTHLRMDYTFDNDMNLSSLTAYHHLKTQILQDLNFRDGRDQPNTRYPATGLPYKSWFLLSQNISYDYSQELRLTSDQSGSFRWTFGGNYLYTNTRAVLYGMKSTGMGSSSTPSLNETMTPSLFGGFYYDLAQGVTLSAEARYQWDKIRNTTVGTNQGFLNPNPQTYEETFTSFSPRVILDYQYSRSSTVYALWSRGYRPGGFNTILMNSTSDVLDQFAAVGAKPAYAQERLDNYELGWKWTFWGGRARTTLALYYDQWRDGQVSTSVPYLIGEVRNLATVTQNIGAVDLKGIEFEGEVRATKNLTLSATFGLTDSKIKAWGICGDCNAVLGNSDTVTEKKLSQTEKIKYSVSAEYKAPFNDNLDWFGRVDYIYRGPYFVDAANVAKVHATNTINLRAGVNNENVSLDVYVKNLLNEDHLIGAIGLDTFNNATTNEIRLGLPELRTFGIRFGYKF